MALEVTTQNIWPVNARRILEEKHVDISSLEKSYNKIYFPWNNNYDSHRNYYSLRIQERSLFIIKPVNTDELEHILNYVKEKNLTIRIMNGRHSSALTFSEVLIDITYFLKIKLNGEILKAGGGLTQGHVNNYLFNQQNEHGKCNIYSNFGSFHHPRIETVSLNAGSAASVGIIGLTSSAGISNLCRMYGLACDYALSFKITLPPTSTSPSKTILCDKDNHVQLFWALRGGMASNFGFVTEITYKIIEVPKITNYSITWDYKEAQKVLILWQKTSPSRPKNFNEDLILHNNPGTENLTIQLGGTYVSEGESDEETQKIIRKTLSYLGGTLTIYPSIEYDDHYRNLVKEREYSNFSIIQPLFCKKFDVGKLLKWMKKGKKLPSSVGISLTLLGGEISKVSSENTAFYPRKAQFFLDIFLKYNQINDGYVMDQWGNGVVADFLKDKMYAYVGFPITFSNIKYTPEIYYGKNTKKLIKIRDHYDPLNILKPCGTLNPHL